MKRFHTSACFKADTKYTRNRNAMHLPLPMSCEVEQCFEHR
ncbi:hypothetical protein ACS15_0676 [Ralstonia insidiosa]|uniref:Uncharacterized protein n=1 Tax=Ralstonia insidiosa TaxID=190721 RepID=A0AAC9BIV9_9RALS|nr:hypothetical protein ACS15_0676 [Ralstonia insidiosa]